MHVTATARRRRARTTGFAIVVLTGSACLGGDTDSAAPLPRELHDLELVDIRTGDAAAALIGRLHGKDVSPRESYVGYYGPPEMRGVLYLSRFNDEQTAQLQLAAMADRIASGSAGFGHHTQFVIGETVVHSVFGFDQVHYFFAEKTDLTWLSMPPPVARAGLAELLEVELDSIPGLGGAHRIIT
jgi:hypothetical protein